MSRLLSASILCCAVAVGATTWNLLGIGRDPQPAGPGAATANGPGPAPGTANPHAALDASLRAARATCTKEALDEVVATLTAKAAAAPTDAALWRLLAEAHLLRALQPSHRSGLVVGEPVYHELPAAVVADLDAGTRALAEAKKNGDDSGDLHRLEAGLLSPRITGLGTALQWNGRIQQAMTKAVERSPDDPRLQLSLGLRSLLAPRFLGHDPARALGYFTRAAQGLPDDERPALFAAMACHLQQQRQQALDWLQQAAQRNPKNDFVRVVLRRVQRGEENPFGRDVVDADLAADAPK